MEGLTMMQGDRDIRIGVLYSRSGWTAATERSMLAATEFAIDEINASGGINGRNLVPVYGDPKGRPSAYRDLARDLLTKKNVKIILGGYTSNQRKAMLGDLDRENGLLCYPAQYEGFEYSRNVRYFGAVPNQNSVLLGLYIMDNLVPRLYNVGSDYVWPRESGRIMRDLVHSRGGEVVGQCYLGEDASAADFDQLMKDIKMHLPCVVFNNFVGDSNMEFYRAYARSGLSAQELPVASLTTSEVDLWEVGPEIATGHITAATYFQSQDNATNVACRDRYHATQAREPRMSMCWEAAYTQTHIVAQTMRQFDSSDVNAVRAGLSGMAFDAPQGRVMIDPLNSHAHVWPKIAIAKSDGQFNIVARTHQAIPPDPYLATYTLNEEHEPDLASYQPMAV